MDSLTIIVTSLAAGIAASLKPTAEQAIKDAYASVKALVQRKYAALSEDTLEQKPDSETKWVSVKEYLIEAGAAEDNELLDKAKLLLDTIKTHDQSIAATLNINFEELEAAYFKLKDVASKGDICNYINPEGITCKRKAQLGKRFCIFHFGHDGPNAEEPPKAAFQAAFDEVI
ncbi:MAG: hypothetical protein ABS69_00765 [Nitrosomonadales bacterium SCN 54-20]|nr:MAG: hypothetical protein ABS69_00765 [Nitrosomonadales bacterium SCN 54-20]